ncbi:MAG: hypothetical protein ABI478_08275, partial [Propionivibrio sp.]
MPRAKNQKPLIEFRGNSLPVLAVSLRSLEVDALAATAIALFGDESFFDGDAAILELAQLPDEAQTEQADWPAITRLFKQHGLNVIGVRGGSEALRNDAAANGLPYFAVIERAPRAPVEVEEGVEEAAPAAPPEDLAVVEEAGEAETAPQYQPTMIVDRPLRSGQQIYARDGDLVVLA